MLTLRPYQQQAVYDIHRGFLNHSRQILTIPTGGGKTAVAAGFIRDCLSYQKKVLVVAERRVLVEQLHSVLARYGIEAGIIMAGYPYKPTMNVQVASLQTIEKIGSFQLADYVIADEVHVCMRKSFMLFLDFCPEVKVLGLTATPFTSNLSKYFDNVICPITANELTQLGNLVPLKTFLVKEVDTSGMAVSGREWRLDDLDKGALNVTGNIVENYLALSRQVFGKQEKAVCFAPGVVSGSELMRQFNDAGVYAVQISYLDTDEYKREVIREFDRKDSDIQILISSTILERGFDNIHIKHLIAARPFRRSFSSWIQELGRVLRSAPGKEFAILQDHSGNYLRFEDDYLDLFNNGVKSIKESPDKKKREEKTDAEKKESKCPSCSHVWPKGSNTCTNCGHVRERKGRDIEYVDGVLVSLEEKRAAELVYKRNIYHQFLSVCDMRGWKPGRAYFLYKDLFKEEPKFRHGRMEPTDHVLNYVKSRDIAYAKSRKKARNYGKIVNSMRGR